ncbi:MAG: iron-containing alcohol dehydrogenase [Verrucomicrobia bacterium]|nr:MAG: iron-containing alcohol dehydrogenase [Verrucomicrobiota bacterium]
MHSLSEIETLAMKAVAEIRATQLKAPQKIIFGAGAFAQLAGLVRARAGGKPVFIVADRTVLARAEMLAHENAGLIFSEVDHEPTVAMVDVAVAQARKLQPGLIVSLGGGSVMDSAKAVAALTTNPGSVADYLEGVGNRTTLENPPRPHIAVPTTAGTGAEATRNAVVAVPEKGVKRSMRFDDMLPVVALLDPELTLTVPRGATAAGGLDTLTQLLESSISSKRKPATTALALLGLPLVREALPICCDEPTNREARAAMMLASFLSGVCLANAGLAMAHGIAAALGALHGVAHGLACGILLPAMLRYNRTACALELATALAAFLNQEKNSGWAGAPLPRAGLETPPTKPMPIAVDAIIETGIVEIEKLQRQLGLPADLRHLRLDAAALQKIAAGAMGRSMSGNPIPMDPEKTLVFLKGIA